MSEIDVYPTKIRVRNDCIEIVGVDITRKKYVMHFPKGDKLLDDLRMLICSDAKDREVIRY